MIHTYEPTIQNKSLKLDNNLVSGFVQQPIPLLPDGFIFMRISIFFNTLFHKQHLHVFQNFENHFLIFILVFKWIFWLLQIEMVKCFSVLEPNLMSYLKFSSSKQLWKYWTGFCGFVMQTYLNDVSFQI